jgi:hypothetical protein
MLRILIAMSTIREGARLVEVLHLAFLQVLPSYLSLPSYVVKGGANLRLFYGSRRRSQDIDLDYIGERFERVEDGVDAALASRAFRDLLRVAGMTMGEPSKPKQTATTRRWKFGVDGPGAVLGSKIEFSARVPVDPEHALATARGDTGRAIGLRAVRAEHYLPPAAIRQKVRALADRAHTEPRDVFDLDLLFASNPAAVGRGELPAATLEAAIAAALAIPYEAFAQLVVEYVEDDFVPVYGRPEAWEEMVLGVVGHLEELR